jgi:spermidine synthase
MRTAAAVLLFQPRIERMLVLGLGGGNVGRYLQRRLPELHVDSVDVDPAVPEVARRFLGFREGPRSTVTVADGRRFLHGSRERWDFIYCDTYIGLSVPFHMTTVQFMREARSRLAPDGVLGVNLAAGLHDPFSRAMYRTIAESFPSVYVFPVPAAANFLVVASPEPRRLTREELMARGRRLDRRWRFDPPLAGLAAERMEIDLETLEVPVLTDEFAPVDRLIHLGGRRPSGVAP